LCFYELSLLYDGLLALLFLPEKKMNASFTAKILRNIKNGDVRISEHGYDELAKDDLRVEEIFADVKMHK
jgi:hypothetical protein